jgi:hypothetical protein
MEGLAMHDTTTRGGEYTHHYSRIPALAAYIDRVGAEQVNFRRFLIKEYSDDRRKYYELKATIKIVTNETTKKSTIKCDTKEYAPTEDELAAIEKALSDVEFPQSMPASWTEAREFIKENENDIVINKVIYTRQFFCLPSLNRKEVVMIQERRDNTETRDKRYLPWTMFMERGGKPRWKEMEPDGDKLPFWKPEKPRKKIRVMIHEGAKAAAFVDGLVNDPERKDELRAHPYGEELSSYEHWGASGGAQAIYRSDMDELRKLVKREEGTIVVYVCDHDTPGEKAAQQFSRAWGDSLVVVRWDKRFDPGFDLADPVPEAARGITLWSHAEPGTWATKRVGETSHGRALYALNEAFAKEWVHVNHPELYISVQFPRLMYDQKGFDHHVASFANTGARVSELLKSYKPTHIDTINYRPDLKPGRHTSRDDGTKFFNTYIPRRWEPYKEAPDVTPLLGYLERVFPNAEERRQAARWAATLIARPQIKMEYGLLLVSETQGVGKTTLADILAEIIGMRNVAYVEEHDIVGRFNDWVEKRLIICEEIYAGHSTAAYNRLKAVATNKTVRVEKKNLPRYNIDNYGHVIACSNSIKALRLDNEDRRWFVPEVTEQKQGREYWAGFYHWLTHEEGYRKIVWWAGDFLTVEPAVVPGEEAPWTATKGEVADAFRSEGIEIVSEIFIFIKRLYETKGELDMKIEVKKDGQVAKLIDLAKRERSCLFFDVDVCEVIRERIGRSDDRPDKPLAVRKLAKALGFKVADREHRFRLINWRSAQCYGISLDQATANRAMELLRDKDPHRGDARDRVEELLSFHELAFELLGSPPLRRN